MRCLLWIVILPLAAALPPRLYTVENYDVSIRADLAKERLDGEVRIRIRSRADIDISALELDAGGIQIMSVVEGQAPRWFERNRSLLFVTLGHPLHPDEARVITLQYQAGSAAGLTFFPDQIYTTVASDWMPCNDRPGERATLHLSINAPAEMKVAASGQLTATHGNITEWRLDTAGEPSWFGFAVGAFTESSSDAEGVKLRVLGTPTPIFEPTLAAMRYLSERTRKHYPGKTYTQVFAHGDVTRSLAGLTLLPESYAQRLAKQPDDLWLITSELAHQWYGIGIATKDWADLWLSEGVSAFLADGFLGQQFGKARYEREIQRSQQIYNLIRAEGKDRPLSYADWTTRKTAGGDIPEHKGAWFLYLVNQLVGDSVFADGLRLYTNAEWGQTANSDDLQKAFDSVTPVPHKGNRKNIAKEGQSALDNLFDMWVNGIAAAKPMKSK